MVSLVSPDTHIHLWRAHGGFRSGVRPRRTSPTTAESWAPGQPVHWQEQTSAARSRSILMRVALIIHLCCALTYLVYRVIFTIGLFPETRSGVWLALQIMFFVYEVLFVALPITHGVEVWNVVQRNCVDFKRIPNDLIATHFTHPDDRKVPPDVSNYPSVDVIIPCHKENIDMVMQVVQAALGIDYPAQLLDVYLCDDGRDELKRTAIEKLKRVGKYSNVHYITRSEHQFAKAGNVNHVLKQTSGHMIVQLDADFIARPQLLQRLLPYFFVWNDDTKLYDFNQTVSYVQTSKYYRNLSPYDYDMFDQRGVSFFTRTQQGRDWLNASPMVGTSNLLNRRAIEAAGYFPCHLKGDDIALSVILNGLGYRSYHVTECVATGLVPPTLRSNFAQRRRLYATDFEVLFSKHGALTESGLSVLQRYIYFTTPMIRFLSITLFFADFISVLVLLAGFFVVDVVQPKTFVILLTLHLTTAQLPKIIECAGDQPVFKSFAGNELFDVVFRHSTLNALFTTLFGSGMSRKPAKKHVICTARTTRKLPSSDRQKRKNSRATRLKNMNRLNTNIDDHEKSGKDVSSKPSLHVNAPGGVRKCGVKSSTVSISTSNEECDESDVDVAYENEYYDSAFVEVGDDDDDDNGNNAVDFDTVRGCASVSKYADHDVEMATTDSTNTAAVMPIFSRDYIRFVFLNLKRCWYNVLSSLIFSSVLILSIVRPPNFKRVLDNGRQVEYNNFGLIALSFGFLLSALIPHIVAVVLCFKRDYILPWLMKDLMQARCDGKVETVNEEGSRGISEKIKGKVSVPGSAVTYVTIVRTVVVTAVLVYTVVETFGPGFI